MSCKLLAADSHTVWVTPTDIDDKSKFISEDLVCPSSQYISSRSCLWIDASSFSMLVWRLFLSEKTAVVYTSKRCVLPIQRNSIGTQAIADVTSIPLFWHSSSKQWSGAGSTVSCEFQLELEVRVKAIVPLMRVSSLAETVSS